MPRVDHVVIVIGGLVEDLLGHLDSERAAHLEVSRELREWPLITLLLALLLLALLLRTPQKENATA